MNRLTSHYPDIHAEIVVDGRLTDIVKDGFAAPHVLGGRLVRILDPWCPPFAGYHLYYPDRRHPTSAFQALLDELRRIA
jgi:DNA-binding transcriptional LysR family regulator